MVSLSTPYTLCKKLKGHAGIILCLAVNEDGRFLASGGEDGTLIWEMSTMRLLQRIPDFAIRGGTSAVLWLRHEDVIEEGLIYGTKAGFLVFCRQTDQKTFEEVHAFPLAFPSEITSLVYDEISNRLAVANQEGTVALFAVDPASMIPTELWTVRPENSLPKSLAFTSQRDVLVFGVHDAIYTLDSSSGNPTETAPFIHGITIGNVACNTIKNVFCVDTVPSCALYRLDNIARIKVFDVPQTKPSQNWPKQVAFAESCRFVVSGSDHGLVYVFDRRSGELVQKLSLNTLFHKLSVNTLFQKLSANTLTTPWVQAVTTATVNGVEYIIAGEASGEGGNNNIYVFKKSWGFGHYTRPAALILALALTVPLYQNSMYFSTWILAKSGIQSMNEIVIPATSPALTPASTSFSQSNAAIGINTVTVIPSIFPFSSSVFSLSSDTTDSSTAVSPSSSFAPTPNSEVVSATFPSSGTLDYTVTTAPTQAITLEYPSSSFGISQPTSSF
ncbi:hypothetical protein VKT23_012618 [Stygiomarasmius scandens]|uniref:WD40 repeat-like protein n=1 Tax=Marasmiellus scandens TaxID=2682957 RepID=A0ABR1J5M6_9AGAR